MADEETRGEPTADDTTTLRTGVVVSTIALAATLESLEGLQDDPVALYHMVEACRDPSHLWPAHARELPEALGLVKRFDAQGCAYIPDVIRRIMVAAAEGEESELRLVDPVAD